MAHAQHAAPGLAHHREGLRHQAVDGLAAGQALTEQRGLRRKVRVAHRLVARFQRPHLPHQALQFFDQALVAAAEDAGE